MTQGKCALLKPVDNLTGTFFTFSQYTQDLTEQYSNADSYRCVPSKYVAMNLDFSSIAKHLSGTVEEKNLQMQKILGEIFQNYFENACTFLRAKYGATDDGFNPEYTRTLFFQTLQKYNLMHITPLVEDSSATTNSSESETHGNVSGLSDEIQFIGDINIYSYNDNADGVGYNEIYCYIPNEAKCTNYKLNAVSAHDAFPYDGEYIAGYENKTSYNGLDWKLENNPNDPFTYVDINDLSLKYYNVGKYKKEFPDLTEDTYPYTLVPECLIPGTISSDEPRKQGDKELDKFKFNTVLVLYDIVHKDDLGIQSTDYYNIPLGIYFAGRYELDEDGTSGAMTNEVTKYVDSEQIYNQGTSYGLRICTRFLSNPFSTEIVENTVTGSSNVSMIAPVLEQMADTMVSVQDILKDKDAMYQLIKDHLAQFKNNQVNVPYVRKLGNKKYWFVNGKNTGAIAQYEYSDPEAIIARAIELILEQVYDKDTINNIINKLLTKEEFNRTIADYAKKEYVDDEISKLRQELKVWLQGIEE